MANFSLTRHARHRTMGLRQLAGRSTKEGRGKRAVWSWIARHSYHSPEQNVKDKNLDHRVILFRSVVRNAAILANNRLCMARRRSTRQKRSLTLSWGL